MTLDLDPIKRRLAEATPGPWHTAMPAIPECDDYDNLSAVESSNTGEVLVDACADANADLIAHAPSDLAALVAEVERLRGVEVAAKAASALLLTARSELIAMWIHGELDMDRIHDELLMRAHVTLIESLGEPSPTH